MRKILVLVVAACLVGAVAIPSLVRAADFSYNGYWQITYQVSDNTGDFDSDDGRDTRAWVNHVFISSFTAKVNDDLYGMMSFRFNDQVWGDAWGGIDGFWFGEHARDVPVPGQAYHKQGTFLDDVWIDFRIPTTPIRARMGIVNQDSPKGIVFGGDQDIPGVVVTVDLDTVRIRPKYIKIRETNPDIGVAWQPCSPAGVGGTCDGEDDTTVWGIDIIGDPTPNVSLGLWWWYMDGGDNQNNLWDGVSAHWVDLSGNFSSGPWNVNADFLFLFGDYDEGCVKGSAHNAYVQTVDGQSVITLDAGSREPTEAAERTNIALFGDRCAGTPNDGVSGDISGFAADVRITYDAGWAVLGLIFAHASGDDNPTDNEYDAFHSIIAWYPINTVMFGGPLEWNNQVSYSLEGGYSLGWNNPGTANGMTLIQLGASKDLTPKLTIVPDITFMWAAESSELSPTHQLAGYPNNTEQYLGTEVDVDLLYKMYDQLTWFIESGVMWAGDYYLYTDGDADDPDVAWQVATGFAYAF
jgi:hypothetical protein